MTEMQKEMQKLISKDELDKAFDARFPKEMQVKLHNAKVAIAGLGGLGSNIAVMLASSSGKSRFTRLRPTVPDRVFLKMVKYLNASSSGRERNASFMVVLIFFSAST